MRYFHVATSIFLTCLVLVFGQILAAGSQRYLIRNDETIAVNIPSTAISGSAPKSCLKPKSKNFNVRFQEMISGTAVFKRVILHMQAIEFYSDMESVPASDIKQCADKTSVAGFAGFHFNNTLCRMFTPKHQFCLSDVGYGDAIYVQDFFWDAKDRVLPKFVPMLDESFLGASARFPSAILDQFQSTLVIKGWDGIESANSRDGIFFLGAPGVGVGVVQNDVLLGIAMGLDIEHCIMDCGLPSNHTVRHLVARGPDEVDQVSPLTYILSECGKTLTFDEQNFTLRTAGYAIRLMSHEGFGCKWYSKPEVDHECAVTIESTSSMMPDLVVEHMHIDGELTGGGCEGDFIKIYSGTNTDSEPLFAGSFCNPEPSAIFNNLELPITVVFFRSAEQYQPALETNLGFTITLQF